MKVHKESIVCVRPLWGVLSDNSQLPSTLTKARLPNGAWHGGILIEKDIIQRGLLGMMTRWFLATEKLRRSCFNSKISSKMPKRVLLQCSICRKCEIFMIKRNNFEMCVAMQHAAAFSSKRQFMVCHICWLEQKQTNNNCLWFLIVKIWLGQIERQVVQVTWLAALLPLWQTLWD